MKSQKQKARSKSVGWSQLIEKLNP